MQANPEFVESGIYLHFSPFSENHAILAPKLSLGLGSLPRKARDITITADVPICDFDAAAQAFAEATAILLRASERKQIAAQVSLTNPQPATTDFSK